LVSISQSIVIQPIGAYVLLLLRRNYNLLPKASINIWSLL